MFNSIFVTSLLLAAALQGGVSIQDPRFPGLEAQFSASVEKAGEIVKPLPGGVLVNSDRVHRFFSDRANKVYLGYDVLLEAGRDSHTVQIRVEPLTAPPSELALMGMNADWTQLSLPTTPVIPEIRLGASVKLDLLVNPATGQKIVDSITVKRRGATNSPPREFTAADAELRFDHPQLRVDGNALPPRDSAGISGAAVWFYVPGRGRFVLSLSSHSGFQKTGEVNGTLLTLREASGVLEIESRQPIAPGSGNFFIYVRHDPSWKPAGSSDNASFLSGAADRVEWIR